MKALTVRANGNVEFTIDNGIPQGANFDTEHPDLTEDIRNKINAMIAQMQQDNIVEQHMEITKQNVAFVHKRDNTDHVHREDNVNAYELFRDLETWGTALLDD